MENRIEVGVVYQLTDGEGNCLVSRRTDKCRDEHWKWDPGGGRVEFQESILNTLRRELMEEYCTKPLASRYLGLREVFRNEPLSHWITFDYLVWVERNTVKLGEPHKIDRLKWVNFEQLARSIRNRPEMYHSQYGVFMDIHFDTILDLF